MKYRDWVALGHLAVILVLCVIGTLQWALWRNDARAALNFALAALMMSAYAMNKMDERR